MSNTKRKVSRYQKDRRKTKKKNNKRKISRYQNKKKINLKSRLKMRGGQQISVYEAAGIKPPEGKTFGNGSLSGMLPKSSFKKSTNINSVRGYLGKEECFKDLRRRFKKCYKKKSNADIVKCKSSLRVLSNDCDSKRGNISIAQLRKMCLNKHVTRKAKCYTKKTLNKEGVKEFFSMGNPMLKCARKSQKNIEFCQLTPEKALELLKTEVNKLRQGKKLFGKKVPYLKYESGENIKSNIFLSEKEIFELDAKLIARLNKLKTHKK